MQIALENVIQVLVAADTQFYSCQLQESALYRSDGARPNNRLRKIKHHQIVMYMSRQLFQDHALLSFVKTNILACRRGELR